MSTQHDVLAGGLIEGDQRSAACFGFRSAVEEDGKQKSHEFSLHFPLEGGEKANGRDKPGHDDEGQSLVRIMLRRIDLAIRHDLFPSRIPACQARAP